MSKKFSEKWKEEKEAKKRKRLEKSGIPPKEDIGKGLLLYVNACILLTAVIVFLTVFISQS